MEINYRYTKCGLFAKGALTEPFDSKDKHDIVCAVLQKIADEENELIVVGMMSTANPLVLIGENHFSPVVSTKEITRSIDKIEISEDGGLNWRDVAIIIPYQ